MQRLKFIALFIATFSWLSLSAQPDSRLSAKAIRNLPGLEVSVAKLRSQSMVNAAFSTTIFINDKRREGTFVYDPTDTTTPDNDGTVLVDPLGRRFKRQYKGQVEIEWFGAIGKGPSIVGTLAQQNAANAAMARINTIAVQKALDWAAANGGTDQDAYSHFPVNKERPAVVHATAGTYLLDQTVLLRGAVKLTGDEGMSFGGTVFLSWECPALNIPAHHLFRIAGAPGTGISAATVIENIRMLGFNTSGQQYAAIYVPSDPGASYNSLYFRQLWSQSSSSGWVGLWIERADDVVCKQFNFDGAANTPQVILGGLDVNNQRVANALFSDCGWYDQRGGAMIVYNVDGLQIVNARVNGTPDNKIPYFIYANDAVYIRNLQVLNSRFTHTNKAYIGKFGLQFNDNDCYEINDRFIWFTGNSSTVIRDAQIRNNRISGYWPDPLYTPFFTDLGVTMSNAQIENIVSSRSTSGSSALCYNLALHDNSSRISTNGVIGFTQVSNAPSANIYPAVLGTMATQSSSNVSITGGNIANLATLSSTIGYVQSLAVDKLNVIHDTGVISGTVTANWTPSVINTLVPPAQLAGGMGYFLSLTMNKSTTPGAEVVFATYFIMIGVTTADSPTPPVLTPIGMSAYNPNSLGFKVALLKPGANTATHGIGLTIADPNYAGGTVTWRLVKAL